MQQVTNRDASAQSGNTFRKFKDTLHIVVTLGFLPRTTTFGVTLALPS